LNILNDAAVTTVTGGTMNSFVVQLYEDVKINHLYCVHHNSTLTAKIDRGDKYFGLDAADDNPWKLIQKFKATVGHYRSSTQAAQKLAEKLKAAGKI
jgi:hypothetical protein